MLSLLTWEIIQALVKFAARAPFHDDNGVAFGTRTRVVSVTARGVNHYTNATMVLGEGIEPSRFPQLFQRQCANTNTAFPRMAGDARFELAARGFGGHRSTRLS